MRLLFVGAGAIGSYVGGYLALAGHAVTFVARPAAAADLRAHGMRLRVAGSERVQTVRDLAVVESIGAAFAGQSYDCLVLAIKSFATQPALAELQRATTSPPPVLCLQNGVDNEPAIAASLGASQVIAGTVTTPVSQRSAVEVVVERQRGLGIALGHPLSEPLIEALNGANLPTRGYPSVGAMKWSKLLSNLVGNATSAILDLPVSEIYADPRLYAVEAAALRECLAMMRVMQYPVVNLPGVPVRLLAWAINLPASLARPLLRRNVGAGRGGKMPSLHVDLHSGRGHTEAAWLNGAVARHGVRCGVDAPTNRLLAETVEALSAGELEKDGFRHRPEALLRLMNAR